MEKSIAIKFLIDIKGITKPIDLYILAEFGKYTYYFFSHKVDIRGLNIPEEFNSSIYYAYLCNAIKQGWIISTIKPTEISAQIQNLLLLTDSSELNMLKNKDYSDLSLEIVPMSKQNMYVWKWQLDKEIEKRHILYTELPLSLLSLAIKEYVSNYFFSVPVCLIYEIPKEICTDLRNLSYLLYVSKTIFKDFIFIDLKDIDLNTVKDLEFASWLQEKNDCDYTNSFYTKEDKILQLKDLNIDIDDIVSLYHIVNGKPKDYIVGKVLSITQEGIELDRIQNLFPKEVLSQQYDLLSNEEKSFINTNIDISQLNTSTITISWFDIGVNYCFAMEEWLLLPLSASNDMKLISIKEGDFYIEQNELIYWVLNSFNYEYNKKKYKHTCFGRKKPLYDYYLQGRIAEKVLFVPK